jgi:hypothetical protein
MLFNLEADVGDAIILYLVPDSVAGTATIVARSDGKEVLSLAANETCQALVDAGRHQTGECGFRVTEQMLPGLAGGRLGIRRRRHKNIDLSPVPCAAFVEKNLADRNPPPAALAA